MRERTIPGPNHGKREAGGGLQTRVNIHGNPISPEVRDDSKLSRVHLPLKTAA